jgi:hypothetical protein
MNNGVNPIIERKITSSKTTINNTIPIATDPILLATIAIPIATKNRIYYQYSLPINGDSYHLYY